MVLIVAQILIGGEESPLLEVGRKDVVTRKANFSREVKDGEERGQNVDLRAHFAHNLWLDASGAEDEARDVVFLQWQRGFAWAQAILPPQPPK